MIRRTAQLNTHTRHTHTQEERNIEKSDPNWQIEAEPVSLSLSLFRVVERLKMFHIYLWQGRSLKTTTKLLKRLTWFSGWLRGERDKKNNLYDTIFQHWKWNPADTRPNRPSDLWTVIIQSKKKKKTHTHTHRAGYTMTTGKKRVERRNVTGTRNQFRQVFFFFFFFFNSLLGDIGEKMEIPVPRFIYLQCFPRKG